MSKGIKNKIQKGSGLYAVILSSIIGVVIIFSLLSVFALITANSNISLENVKYFCLLALLIAVFIASAVSAYLNRSMKGLIVGLLTSSVISVIFLLTVVIINCGEVSTFALLISIGSILIGLPSGIIGANLKH